LAPTSTPELAKPSPELPLELTEVGFNDELGSPHDVVVSGSYAYIADSQNGLRVVDVSDPSTPNEVGGFEPLGSTSGNGVFFSAPYAYLADGLGLLMLDLSNPSSPQEMGFYDSQGFAVKVHVSGDYAYVAGREGGLNIADVSDPREPLHAADYFEAGSVHVRDVFVSGSHAYVAMQGDGLRVVDVSDPGSPEEVGLFDTVGAAEAIYVSESTAYLADGEGGLRVFAISDPENPIEVGFYDTPGYAQDVIVSGDYAFLGDGTSGLILALDISDPASPRVAGEYETAGFVWGVYVGDNRVYVANGEHGLRILRVDLN
jgi:hypothetical protein